MLDKKSDTGLGYVAAAGTFRELVTVDGEASVFTEAQEQAWEEEQKRAQAVLRIPSRTLPSQYCAFLKGTAN